MGILDLLQRGRRLNRSGHALISSSQTLSYDAMISNAEGAARGLLARGARQGSRAAVLSGNNAEAVCASLGIMASAMVYLPVNAKNAVAENIGLLNRFDCEVLFYHDALSATVAAMRPALTSVRIFVRFGGVTGDESLSDLLDAGRSFLGELPEPSLHDIAWLGQTGGTTGVPKGVQLSWRAIYAYLEKYMIELPESCPVMLVATPMTHAAGMLALPTFVRGGHLVIMEKFDAEEYLDVLQRERVTTAFLPPTAIYRLLDARNVDTVDCGSLRYLLYGAAPMSVPRLKQALSVFGPVMAQVYGQSECHTVISIMRPEDHFSDLQTRRLADDGRLNSCGRPTIGTTVKISDEADRSLPRGTVGEICVMSDIAMSGYYKDPAATRTVVKDGYVHTGDLGRLDDDGFLYIVGRKKDLVISGGLNVYPVEVENVLDAHDAVAESAVVGLPHDDWGEIVVAVVRLNEGENANAGELIAFAKDRLGSIKCPKELYIWNDLPRSAAGKILKMAIRERLVQNRTPNS